jgi:hypothetical protein
MRMNEFFSHYLRLEPPTWVFLSTFLAIGLFLMFHRFWSLRNLDIVLVLLFTPGIMLVYEGSQRRKLETAAGITQLVGPSSASSDSNLPLDSATASTANPASRSPNPEGTNEGTAAVSTQLDTAKEKSSPDKPSSVRWKAESFLYLGYLWLIIASTLLSIRLLLDTAIVRRPMLDPNLSSGGMLFLGASLLAYLLVNVAISNPMEQNQKSPNMGPGYILMNGLPNIATLPNAYGKNGENDEAPAPAVSQTMKLLVARCMSIGANLIMVISIVAIGYWHFGNLKTGVGAATLYLLLPYTSHMTGQVDHVVPSALLLLAVLLYRQPFAAGLCLGFAAGVVYYPFSLLPLWCSFYWQRGIRRFSFGFLTSIVTLIVIMVILQPNNLVQHLGLMFGVKQVAMTGMDGIWGLGWYPLLRIPLIVAFVLLSISFVAWPAQKSLATLMSCSAALMAATQCWHGFGGGLYLAWFVPLALLTIFRPNLDYCVALEVVRPFRRKATKSATDVPTSATAA